MSPCYFKQNKYETGAHMQIDTRRNEIKRLQKREAVQYPENIGQ